MTVTAFAYCWSSRYTPAELINTASDYCDPVPPEMDVCHDNHFYYMLKTRSICQTGEKDLKSQSLVASGPGLRPLSVVVLPLRSTYQQWRDDE